MMRRGCLVFNAIYRDMSNYVHCENKQARINLTAYVDKRGDIM